LAGLDIGKTTSLVGAAGKVMVDAIYLPVIKAVIPQRPNTGFDFLDAV